MAHANDAMGLWMRLLVTHLAPPVDVGGYVLIGDPSDLAPRAWCPLFVALFNVNGVVVV